MTAGFSRLPGAASGWIDELAIAALESLARCRRTRTTQGEGWMPDPEEEIAEEGDDGGARAGDPDAGDPPSD